MDWKKYGWRYELDGGRYEVEQAPGCALYEAWFIDTDLTDLHSGDGFSTLEEAFAACEAHNAARIAANGK